MVFVTAALSAAVWLAQSLRLVDLIVNRGLSAEMFLYLALLILPRFLDIVLPIGAFIAVLFVFNRLTAESELVVMRAAGLGPSRAGPAGLCAWPASPSLVLMSLSAYFLPASNREFKDLQFEIRNRFVSSLLQEGAFTTISDKLTIYIGGRDERGEVDRPPDQRRARPAAAGHDHRRARRFCRRCGRARASSWSTAAGSSYDRDDRQAVGADLRPLHARPRHAARRARRALS